MKKNKKKKGKLEVAAAAAAKGRGKGSKDVGIVNRCCYCHLTFILFCAEGARSPCGMVGGLCTTRACFGKAYEHIAVSG